MNSYYERISIKKYKISTNFIKKIQIVNNFYNYSTILIKIQINLQILSKKIQIILQLFYNFNKNTN